MAYDRPRRHIATVMAFLLIAAAPLSAASAKTRRRAPAAAAGVPTKTTAPCYQTYLLESTPAPVWPHQTPAPATPTPAPAPAATQTPTPAASPAATPTPAPTPEIAKVQVGDLKQDETIDLVQGEERTLKVKALAADNTEVTGITSKLTATKDGVVKIVPKAGSANEYTLTGEAVKNQDSTSVKVEVNGAERPEAKFNVRVLEAVKSVTMEIDGSGVGNSVIMSEGQTVTLKPKLVGEQGTTLDATTQQFADPAISPQLTQLLTIKRKADTGEYTLTSRGIPSNVTPPVVGQVTFTPLKGLGKQAASPLVLDITVNQSFGYITFEPPPRGFLLPGGTFTTVAVVRGRNGNPLGTYGVQYDFENREDATWVTLAPEGNKLNVYWNDPSPDEIPAAANGGKKSRPAQVRIRAVARSSTGGADIVGEVVVRMGEISKFSLLKVKMNVMDSLTSSDLYGKVMTEDYYVLTVRLFNNLKDDVTGQFTGDSILAYSSSIELAVGVEKRFDPGTNSAFPNVISKSEADKIYKSRQKAAAELAEAQANAAIATAKADQENLNHAIEAEETARAEARAAILKAENKRIEARKLYLRAQEAQKKANGAGGREAKAARDDAKTAAAVADAAFREAGNLTIDANAKIMAAREATDNINNVRAAIARNAANRATISQNIAEGGDPDTAVNDGKWHPLTPADLYRITEPKPAADVPMPPLPELNSVDDLAPRPAQQPGATPTPPAPADNDGTLPDPQCRGVITYRPFTFEMMVNTVDRRDERSRRSRIFTILEGLGTGASFITSIAVPGNSSDLPLGLEKYRNLLIPGLDRIYPNYKEQWRQNIVSQAMKEIEEIPFGSDITRVIFVPKKTIRGLVRGHQTRISEICPFFFRIQVAIITKRGTVSASTQ